jgi:hypothetical protein
MIVENKGGASGNIGHEYVMKANPDGYTLILSSSGVVVNNPHLFKQLNFNWYVDFVPISMVATAGQVLVVHPSVPVKSVAELTAMAKAKPGSINFGSGGKGISSHITGELYKAAAGIDIVHIPYKGSGQAVADVAAGQIQMVFSDMAPAVASVSEDPDAPATSDDPTVAPALKGLIIGERGGRVALQAADAPAAVWVKVGEKVGNWTVEAITVRGVRLRNGDNVAEIKFSKEN